MKLGWATNIAAAGAGGRHAGPRAFADECALELGQGSHNVKKQATASRLGVDRFRQTAERNAATFEQRNDADEVGETAPQAIKFPGYEDIARLEHAERLIERWTVDRTP